MEYILRNPLPNVCSGSILAFEVNVLKPTIVVTFFTSQPSFNTKTETITLYGLFQLSMLLEASLSNLSSS